MVFIDSTAVNVALPAIGDDLAADFAAFQWVINGYLITLGAFVLVGGALGDLYGHRRVFVLGVAGFGVTSLLCGVAPTTGTLIVARILQGVAGALVLPGSLALIQGGFHVADRGAAIGAWSGFSGLATIVGPLLGGWMIDTISWRPIFLINPAVAALAIWAAVAFVPESRAARPAPRLDYAGAGSGVVALGGIVYALIEGPAGGWTRPGVVMAGVLGIAASALFLAVESRTKHPMLPLHFFRSVRFAGVNGTTFVVYFVLSGVFFLLMLQFQRVLGYTAFQAGLATSPITGLLFVLSPRAGTLAQRIGPRPFMTGGPLVAAAGIALLAHVQPGARYVTQILPAIVVFGFGLASTVAPLTAAALAALDDRYAGLAAGVNNAVSRVALLLGVALLPLAAGLSGIDRVAGVEFAEGFARAMRTGALVLVGGGVIAAVTMGGALQRRGSG